MSFELPLRKLAVHELMCKEAQVYGINCWQFWQNVRLGHQIWFLLWCTVACASLVMLQVSLILCHALRRCKCTLTCDAIWHMLKP